MTQWLQREHAAGVRMFEVGSFLPAARFPQFSDVRDMVSATKSLNGACVAALTLNERGAEDAMQTDVDEKVFLVSATEGYNRANTRRARRGHSEHAGRITAIHSEAGPGSPRLHIALAMEVG